MRTHPVAVVAMLSLARCAGGDPDALIDHTVAELTVVPSGVLCVRVTVTEPGAAARNVNAAVTAAASAQIDLGVVAAGSVTFLGSAYNVACGSVGANTRPSWVGDPVVATIRRGLVNSVALTLRPLTTTTTSVDFALPVTSIASHPAQNVTYTVMQDGTVRVWGGGRNLVSQMLFLGDGSPAGTSSPQPRTVPGLTNIAQVAVGSSHACALTHDGVARCWGTNNYGELGANTDSPWSPTPVLVNTTVRFRTLYLGQDETCAADRSEDRPLLWCWGHSQGPGDGASFADTATPRNTGREASERPVIQAGTGDWCALNYAGEVVRWPRQSLSEERLSYPRSRSLANQLSSLVGVDHGGRAWRDDSYILGATQTQQVAGGYTHLCGIRTSGGVWCSGAGERGQLGGALEAGVTFSASALDVVGIEQATQLALGERHSCALLSDGTVRCWGANEFGQLGNGTRTDAHFPVRVRF
jgi:hypothetical protein